MVLPRGGSKIFPYMSVHPPTTLLEKGGVQKPILSAKKVFTLDCPTLLLTFKDVGLSKEDIMKNIVDYCKVHLRGALRVIVSQELYQNGGKHFHVFIDTCHINKSWTLKELDAFGGVHGHYSPIRKTVKKVIAYVVKDGVYCSHKHGFFGDNPTIIEDIEDAVLTYAYESPHYKFAEFLRMNKTGDTIKPRNFKK